jgi:hypothetical protein
MTKETGAGVADAARTTQGMFGRLFAKAFASMTPAERKETIADAMVSAGVSELLGKAHDLMDGKQSGGISQVEDLWDGPPDEMPKHKRVAGHSGSHAGDTTIVGPGQSASGDGATKMSKEYAEPAPQGGTAEATNRLGEMLSMGKAMKALIKAVEALSQQNATLSAAVTVLSDDVGSVRKAVAKAIAKAEKEDDKESESGEEDEEEEADEEAGETESGSGTEIEITNEMDEEDESESDDDKKAAKSAAKARVFAKNRLTLARGRLAKALDAELDGKVKSAARHRGVAKAHVAKAQAFAASAKATRPQAVAKAAALDKVLRAIGKAIQSKTENQDKWPDGGDKKAGTGGMAKAVDPAVVAVPDIAALQASVKKMSDELESAHKGLGLFKTNVTGMFNAISGQSRGDGQPPVVVLAKGGAAVAAQDVDVRGKIEALRSSGVISQQQADSAEDVLGQVVAMSKGFPLDPMIVKSRIGVMPAPLQNLFAEAA